MGSTAKLHPEPCQAWGPKARLPDATWEVPVLAQVAGINASTRRCSRRWLQRLASARRPIAIDRARLERQMRELALDHVAERVGDQAYLARLTQLRAEVGALDEPPQGRCQRNGRWSGSAH